MTDIVKIGAIAVCSTLLILILRQKNPLYATLTALAAACLMIFFSLDSFGSIFESFTSLFERGGIDSEYYKSVVKVIAVAYFTEITAALCRDAGENGIATKLELGGRVSVLILTMPAVTNLLEVIIEALALI